MQREEEERRHGDTDGESLSAMRTSENQAENRETQRVTSETD